MKINILLSGKIDMDKDTLFKALKRQTKSTLLNLLQATYCETTPQQKRCIFGELMKESKPLKATGKIVVKESENFYKDSLAGVYYAPFDVNSKSFSRIPDKTEEWFKKLGDLLQFSTYLTRNNKHTFAVESFKILYELIEKMENGDEIIFADEYGSWMIPGNEADFLDAYISSLAKVKIAEEYTRIVIPLIKRDSRSSFCNKIYSLAIKHCDDGQRESLIEAIKEQNIKIKSTH